MSCRANLAFDTPRAGAAVLRYTLAAAAQSFATAPKRMAMKADANSPFRSQKSTLILAAFLPLVFARAVAADTLVVLNKSDHEAALVDPAAYQVVAKLPTGKGAARSGYLARWPLCIRF